MAIQCLVDHGIAKKTKIYIDGECVKIVSHRIVSPKDLARSEVGEQYLERVREMERQGAIRYALRCLSRQSLHSKKLERKLRDHFLDDEVIASVVQYCRNAALLNDDEWISHRTHNWQSQGKSMAEIHARLRKDRVDSREVRGDDMAALERLIPKKYPQLLEANTPSQEQWKALQALQRRGFSLDTVQDFLQKKQALAMMGQ